MLLHEEVPSSGDDLQLGFEDDDGGRRAAELAASGSPVRMCRVPRRTENWGLWRAADPTELHTIISSLPVWPWTDVTVHALSDHRVGTRPTA